MEIKSLKARKILDSRGNFTVEVLLNGSFKASVPSGASTGKKEAVELDASFAASNVNEIIFPALKGMDILDQEKLDKKMIELDGTEKKSKLGANAILPVSIAVLKAASGHYNIPLYKHIENLYGEKKDSFPLPCFNVINGGAHAGNGLDIQEFMLIPQNKEYDKNLEEAVSAYHNLKRELIKRYGREAVNVGDEGGFAPPISSVKEALSLMPGKIGLDCAASHFYKEGSYYLDNSVFTREGLVKLYKNLIEEFPIVLIEDPFDEEDIEGWKEAKALKTLIIGDDLTVTNNKLIKEFSEYIGGVIIKPNQIGTVTEVLSSVREARKNNLKIIVSHRSGETTDSFIADFSVGVSAEYIKTGAPSRGERVVKYNRLLEIYREKCQ